MYPVDNNSGLGSGPIKTNFRYWHSEFQDSSSTKFKKIQKIFFLKSQNFQKQRDL